ncbi:MAG TPA: NADH-quinone oxidoreductase subunit L [Ktedonobacteraceae bacterium]|nr:NADH-quinone oxidoreductase subunit L [Ktedonobacteraceae bacterium]
MAFYQASWLILLSPLFSFAVIIFGTRMWDLASRPRVAATTTHEEEHGSEGEDHGEHGEGDDEDPKVPRLTTGARISGYVGILIVALACIYSWLLLLNTAGVISIAPALPSGGITVLSYDWLNQGTASYVVSFRIDNLAIAMMVVVTTISLLVQVYSQGYMENSAGYARFFSYLSLFTFSMLVIVFAQNFLVIFVGWELVGLSSYLLIGFWINKQAQPDQDRPAPATAAIQAFITNRVGDVGFIIGIMILFSTTGTFDFLTLSSKTDPHGVVHAFAGNTTLLTVAMILIFCGAIGKSAQLPLTVWLPTAMEGPTPVSALIHAATMVAAGVYMVARTYPLFSAAPVALGVVGWVGGITALYAALTALTQTDFKRVLAFSTISQLGYMFVGLGVAAGTDIGSGAGMFHLFTHAFFKALLFLGAGSVIHSLHHATHEETQDMRKMGGLAKYMPITAITWLVATLTISGFPFFSGFYSKDNIIALAFDQGNYGLYIITLGTAGLTAFYMLRAYILAFGGKGGGFGGLWGGTYRGVGEPHEAPLTITIPLIVLAIASIIAGYWTGFFSYVQPGAPALNIGEVLSNPLTWIGVLVAFIGLGWAYVLYTRFDLATIHDVVENNAVLRFLYQLTLRKFYIDDLYALFIRYVVFGISHIEAAFDTYVVDGIVNGVAGAVTGLGRGVRRVETGKVQSYMIGFFGGIAVLAIVVFALVIFVK